MITLGDLDIVAGNCLIRDAGGVHDPALRHYCPILQMRKYQLCGLLIILFIIIIILLVIIMVSYLEEDGHAAVIGRNIREDKGRSQPARAWTNLF